MVLEVCTEIVLCEWAHCWLSVVFKQNMDNGVSVARFAFDLKQSPVLPEKKAAHQKSNICWVSLIDDTERKFFHNYSTAL
jgi:hypothetical protein